MLLPTLTDFLRLQALRRGSSGGLHFRGQPYPFARLADAADRIAARLARMGAGRGTRVVLVSGNHPLLLACHYACWSLGAVSVPAGVRSTLDELCHVATHAGATILLSDPERADLVRHAARALAVPALRVEFDDAVKLTNLTRSPAKNSPKPRAPGPEDLATLAYTSGTTGKPKGVMVTHANLHWSALACANARGDTEASVGSCISPLTHTPVFVSHLLCRVVFGQTAVLLEKFDVDAILGAVERYGITDLTLIAGMVFDITSLKAIPERQRQSVRKVSVGGAATPMDAKRALAAIFEGAEIIEAYGQSESTDGVAMARGTSIFDRPGTVGCSNPFVSVRIRRADGTLAAPDQEGEIVVGGPTIMKGYWRDPRATAAQVRDGWLHTGDLGRQDSDGYVYITGRVKDLIITGGENVSPVEVEEVLRRHPAVADVAVIGTPHPRWGEQVTAIVVTHAGAPRNPAPIVEFAGRYLAGFKKPRRIEFVDHLPRNATNKVQTGLLKEMFADKEE